MEKSFVKLVLTQEVVEKLCQDSPEFKVELEQMALKWVRQSVIKPLADEGTEHIKEYAKNNVRQLMEAVFNGDMFEDVKSTKYFLKEHDKLIKAVARIVLDELAPTPEATRKFWDYVREKRVELLHQYEEKLAKYLDPVSIEDVIRTQVNRRVNEIVVNLARSEK